VHKSQTINTVSNTQYTPWKMNFTANNWTPS